MHHNSDLSRNEKELQAEMTSYLVSKHLGIDTKATSTRYIANWTNDLKSTDAKKLEKLLVIVQHTALQIIREIEK